MFGWTKKSDYEEFKDRIAKIEQKIALLGVWEQKVDQLLKNLRGLVNRRLNGSDDLEPINKDSGIVNGVFIKESVM